GRDLPERRDARLVYFRMLEQARNPALFGQGRFADDYDGRIDAIALHFAVMMERLQDDGEDGKILNQAMFDEMKDDFEIALREQAIGDTGVKKRIKPMIGHFYDRLKAYTDALSSEKPRESLAGALQGEGREVFAEKLADYAIAWLVSLKSLPLKKITSGRFYFPEL
ncbi:MAG: ubiquinol-cytochrome C chaperone family protein, partial [Pseudomonadota bacterium]